MSKSKVAALAKCKQITAKRVPAKAIQINYFSSKGDNTDRSALGPTQWAERVLLQRRRRPWRCNNKGTKTDFSHHSTGRYRDALASTPCKTCVFLFVNLYSQPDWLHLLASRPFSSHVLKEAFFPVCNIESADELFRATVLADRMRSLVQNSQPNGN